MAIDKPRIKKAINEILLAIGEDPEREGLQGTPRRVADMYEELFAGLHSDPGSVLDIYFDEDHEEMVLVKDIPFHSLCEHHLLPFFGKGHVLYCPRKGKLTGLSKLSRLVDIVASRPQLQERLTTTIVNTIMEKLDPHGVVVVLEAEHMCMSMRGVKKPGSKTVTSAIRGMFRRDEASRAEAMALIHNG